MNVDKLKKMNVLADTLKTHGLAATREDAACLAGDIVGSKDEQELANIFVTEEQSVHVETEEVAHAQEPTPQTNSKEILDEMKGILQNFADQFCDEINKINEKLDAHEKKFSNYEKPTETVAPTKHEEIKEEPQTQIITDENSKDNNNPRSGEYVSNDVSIEKFFYCGTK